MRPLRSILFLALALTARAGDYFPTDDASWQTTSAAEAGADPVLLAGAVDYARLGHSTSLVILHRGRILIENYWEGATRSRRQALYSATKAMVSALVGRLVEQGEFESLAQKSADFIPEWRTVAGKQEITLRQHLEMTTGLEGGRQNLVLGAIVKNERTFAVNLPLTHSPGTHWTYNNPAYRLLFSIIQTATGERLDTLFAQQIAVPIGMSEAGWVIRNEWVGQSVIENYQHVEASALSAARFGLLVLRGGVWNGTRVVPAGFLAQATASSQALNPSYGFLWWLNHGAGAGGHQQLFDGLLREGPYFPDAPPDAFAALGLNDQMIAVIPSLDLVVVRQGAQPLGAGSEAVSPEQNILLGKIARAFGYDGQRQPLTLHITTQPGAVHLTWPTWFGREYVLEQLPVLDSAPWQPAGSGPLPGDGLPLATDRPMDAPQCFFRVGTRLLSP